MNTFINVWFSSPFKHLLPHQKIYIYIIVKIYTKVLVFIKYFKFFIHTCVSYVIYGMYVALTVKHVSIP